MNCIIRTTIDACALPLRDYAAAVNEISRQSIAALMSSGHITVGNLLTPDEVTDAFKT